MPVVVGDGLKTIDVPESEVGNFLDEVKAKTNSLPSKSAKQAATKTAKSTQQGSTILFLFALFGLIFLASYLVHKAGGPHKVEAAVDHFFLRAKLYVTGKRGSYTALRGSELPR